MNATSLNVILIEDDQADAQLIEDLLKQSAEQRYSLTRSTSLKEGLARAADGTFDIMLLDLYLPDSQGLDTLRNAYQKAPHLPIVVLTGLSDYKMGTKAIQAGAQDYLIKDEITLPLLTRFIRNAVERKQLLTELQQKENFAQSILNSLPAHVAVLDRDGTIVRTNEAWRDFSVNNGGDPDAYLGADYIELCRMAAETDPTMKVCFEGLKEVVEGKVKSFDFEYPCATATKALWFLMKATPLKTQEGGLVMSHFDVTALKEAEAQIKKLSEVLADRTYSHYLAMSKGKGAITLASTDGNKNNKVLYDLIPDYQELVIRYVRAVRIREDRPSEAVQAFAQRLAMLQIQARDIVRLHLGVLSQFTSEILPAQEKALANDARLLLLELLGNLMDQYLKLWQEDQAVIEENQL